MVLRHLQLGSPGKVVERQQAVRDGGQTCSSRHGRVEVDDRGGVLADPDAGTTEIQVRLEQFRVLGRRPFEPGDGIEQPLATLEQYTEVEAVSCRPTAPDERSLEGLRRLGVAAEGEVHASLSERC